MIKSQTTQKIATNTLWQLVGKGISMSITVLAVYIVSRIYGREGFGEFSLMQAWPALFFIVVDFGINAIAARELSKDWELASKYIGNILIMRMCFSLFLMLLMAAVVYFFPYSASLKFGIILSSFLIMTQALYSTLNIVFQVKLRYDYSVLGYVGGYLVILVLIIFLSINQYNIIWVNFGYVIGGLVTFLLNYKFVTKLGIKPSFELDVRVWKSLLVQSLPLGLMFIFSQLNFKSDSLMLSALPVPPEYGLNNTESVAVYNLPYKIFEVALVVPTFFMNAAYPIFVRHAEEGPRKLKKTFTRTLKTLSVLGLVCGLLGVVFSKFAIDILGGVEFHQSILVLQILLSGLVIYFISAPLSWLIVTLDKQIYLPWVYLINAVFNILANLFFIPIYSFYAAAVITHLSELLILIFLALAARKAWDLKYAS